MVFGLRVAGCVVLVSGFRLLVAGCVFRVMTYHKYGLPKKEAFDLVVENFFRIQLAPKKGGCYHAVVTFEVYKIIDRG